MIGDWFLVETLSEVPHVLIMGQRNKFWRPLSNQFRGISYTAIKKLLETVINNLKQSQLLLDIDGLKLVLARPVLGPDRHVHGILMWIGSPDKFPQQEPEVNAWSLNMNNSVVPDLITLSAGNSIPLFGRMANTVTMTDWLSNCVRLADIVETLSVLEAQTVSSHYTGDWIQRGGVVMKYFMQPKETVEGKSILGLSVKLLELLPATDNDYMMHSMFETMADHYNMSIAILHSESMHIFAWLTKPCVKLTSEIISGRKSAPCPDFLHPIPLHDTLQFGVYCENFYKKEDN